MKYLLRSTTLRRTIFALFISINISAQVPQNKSGSITPGEVSDVNKDQNSKIKIVLPANLYFQVDQQSNIYSNSILNCSTLKNDILLSLSSTRQGLTAYDRQINGTPSTAMDNSRLLIKAIYNSTILDKKEVKVTIVKGQSKKKTVKILDTGDSLTDLGSWQAVLKKLLENNDSVYVNFIGSMIERVSLGQGAEPDYVTDVNSEVLSGGNLSFITQSSGAAKILTVKGLKERPRTGYPGTSYVDDNGTTWVARGMKLKQQSDGTYSGKIKIGKLESDPNYGDKTSDDNKTAKGFPKAGKISKTVSYEGHTYDGDKVIYYTDVENADFNPFWNLKTKEIDFTNYFNSCGFESPDIFMMQWGYNEVGNYEAISGSNVTTSLNRAIQVIDKFHSQYPDAKVIFGIECYGCTLKSAADAKKYSILNYAEKIINTFESDTYKGFVYLVPIYAEVDPVYGYGPVQNKVLCDLYPKVTTQALVNGYDGIHPPYDYGCTEMSRAYRPVINAILQNNK
jgi:hypothetical protein